MTGNHQPLALPRAPADVDDPTRPALPFSVNYPPDTLIASHSHFRGQLLYATSGVMIVTTEQGTWVVPSQRAVWIPPGRVHSIECRGVVSMRTLYFQPGAATLESNSCTVLQVSSLLRELLIRASLFSADYPQEGPEARLIAVILDLLSITEVEALDVPAPSDPRLVKIAAALAENPADRSTLEEWGRKVGASSRTLARLFLKQTGMTFGDWRRQLRMTEAVVELSTGASITAVAFDVGYESPSAFIAAFRRSLGTTPGQFVANLVESHHRLAVMDA